ncbi:hypothetical protein P4538_03095, partial [Geobacillus stearothermophilus]|nr:hypothetical protein [Geobacillus stearothermophilus]
RQKVVFILPMVTKFFCYGSLYSETCCWSQPLFALKSMVNPVFFFGEMPLIGARQPFSPVFHGTGLQRNEYK